MKRIKPYLDISRIGKFRFFSGIIIYILFTLILNTLIRKFLIGFNSLLSIISPSYRSFDFFYKLSTYESLFIGLLSSSLGFCFLIYIWTGKVVVKNRINHRFRQAQYKSLLIFGLILFVLSRFVLIYCTFPFDGFEFNLKKDFGYLPFLMPLHIFLSNWNNILILYRVRVFLFLSFIITIIFGLILGYLK